MEIKMSSFMIYTKEKKKKFKKFSLWWRNEVTNDCVTA